jgi:AhpD family alkylhydroperoxidase
MPKLEVFDPPMCCPTGVCGPEVDPALARIASDLEWLRSNGVEVERFNLAHEPAAFGTNPVVSDAIRDRGDGLPLILLDGRIVAQGSYPSRAVLAELTGVGAPKSVYTEQVQVLVAIGAAIAANCEPCFRHHFDKARKLGVSKEDVARAVKTAQGVKETPARAMLDLAEKYTGARVATREAPSAGCAPPAEAAVGAERPVSTASKCC